MQTMLQGCGKSGAEGAWAPQFLSEQLPYLNQGADYAHHSTTSPLRIFRPCDGPVLYSSMRQRQIENRKSLI